MCSETAFDNGLSEMSTDHELGSPPLRWVMTIIKTISIAVTNCPPDPCASLKEPLWNVSQVM